ncbi:UNVERIFIED_CONTAM: Expansin-A4, partial [Sesamum angustifolium]
DEPQWCHPGSPPSLSLPPTSAARQTMRCPTKRWLVQSARTHFDLAMPMFLKIAEYRAGIVPVSYRRDIVEGLGEGVEDGLDGNEPEWGQNWQSNAVLVGQSLSFRVKASDHRSSTSWNMVLLTGNSGRHRQKL